MKPFFIALFITAELRALQMIKIKQSATMVIYWQLNHKMRDGVILNL